MRLTMKISETGSSLKRILLLGLMEGLAVTVGVARTSVGLTVRVAMVLVLVSLRMSVFDLLALRIVTRIGRVKKRSNNAKNGMQRTAEIQDPN